LKVDGPGEEEGIMEDAVVMVEYFSNLRLLIIKFIKNANISRSLCRLSNELRYVEWSYYPFKYFPSSFQPIHLVELILVHSSIKQLWKGKKVLHLNSLINSIEKKVPFVKNKKTKELNVSSYFGFHVTESAQFEIFVSTRFQKSNRDTKF
jgi:hypothetical protein